MLNKNILAISAITASLLIWCGGGSSSSSDVNATDTNTSQETVIDNPTIISNLKVTPITVSTRSVQASSDFAISYTVEDKDGLVNSAIHVKGEDGIEIKTQTFTFQATQTKENVSATFNISKIGNYSVEVEAKGVGNSSSSSKKSGATFEVTSKDEPTPTPIDNLPNKKWPSVSNITETTATISNRITDPDWVINIKYYLNWVEVISPNLTWLTAGTTYEVYTSASVKNGETWVYENVESEKVSFTTQSEAVNQAPTTPTISDLTDITLWDTINPTCSSTDPEGQGLTYTYYVDNAEITLPYTPTTAWTKTFKCEVSDGENTVSNGQTFEVNEVAISQPTISMDNQQVNDRWWLTPTDLPTPTTTNVVSWAKYSIEWNPNSTMITINENTWVITWEWDLPSWHQTYTINLKVTNPDWWTQTTTFNLKVIDNI